MENRGKRLVSMAVGLRGTVNMSKEETLTFDLKQLSLVDDLITELILDHFLDMTTHKMGSANRIFNEYANELKLILKNFQYSYNYEETTNNLYKIIMDSKVVIDGNDIDRKLRACMQLYLSLLDKSTGVTIANCDRYSGDSYRGAMLVTTKQFKKYEIVDTITGNMVKLSTDEESELRSVGKDFSILNYSSNTNLLLGPISFVNHDCKPNCKYTNRKGKLCVQFIRNVDTDEEITSYYGKHYFGRNNTDCECLTCQNNRKVHKETTDIGVLDCPVLNYSMSIERPLENSFLKVVLSPSRSMLDVAVPSYSIEMEYSPKGPILNNSTSIEAPLKNSCLKVIPSPSRSTVDVAVPTYSIEMEYSPKGILGKIKGRRIKKNLASTVFNVECNDAYEWDKQSTVLDYSVGVEEGDERERDGGCYDMAFKGFPEFKRTSRRASTRMNDGNNEEIGSISSEEEPYASSESCYQPSHDSESGSGSNSSFLSHGSSTICIPTARNASTPSTHNSSRDLDDDNTSLSCSLSTTTISSPLSKEVAVVEPFTNSCTAPNLSVFKQARTTFKQTNNLSVKAIVVEPKNSSSKKQTCPFCGVQVVQLPRHFKKHKNQPEVRYALSLPEKDPQRLKMLDTLRKRGNFIHNNKVLASGVGDLVVKKRPEYVQTDHTFVPCPYCLAFYVKSSLFRHTKVCNQRTDKSKQYCVQAKGALLLPINSAASEDLKKRVISRMIVDEVNGAIMKDTLILLYGSMLCDQFSGEDEQHLNLYISTKMRELGRLLLALKKIDKDIPDLSFALAGNKFDTVIAAVKDVTGFDNTTGKVKIPSLATKLGHAIVKCCALARANAIRNKDDLSQKNIERFLQIYQSEWNIKISKRARNTLYKAKFNKPILLPVAEDVRILKQYLESKEINLVQKLVSDVNYVNWSQLSEIILMKLICYNRRRAGEVQRLSIECFNKPIKIDKNSQIYSSLSKMEQWLATTHYLVETRGKRGRKIAIIIPSTTYENMRILLQNRLYVEIPKENNHFFAALNVEGCINATNIVKKIAMDSGVQNPSSFRSTILRKHIATMSQVLSLRHHEIDSLANFMGHDISVHREYYKLPDNSIQLAKITKLLTVMETGDVEMFKGKNFDNLDVLEREAKEDSGKDSSEDSNTVNSTEELEDLENAAEIKNVLERRNKKKYMLPQHRVPAEKKEASVEIKFQRQMVIRRPWTVEEVAAVQRHLNHFIVLKKVPRKQDCEACKATEPALRDRSWRHIKSWVHNKIRF